MCTCMYVYVYSRGGSQQQRVREMSSPTPLDPETTHLLQNYRCQQQLLGLSRRGLRDTKPWSAPKCQKKQEDGWWAQEHRTGVEARQLVPDESESVGIRVPCRR